MGNQINANGSRPSQRVRRPKPRGFSGGLVLLLLWITIGSTDLAAVGSRQTENLILITLDGLRIEEMFAGIDLKVLRLINKKGKLEDYPLYRKFWAPTPRQRRTKLMPFFWGTWMKKFGSIFGNRSRNSNVLISNRHRFSYPGYSEILTGEAHDDVIDSNENRQNPFPTVLDFLRDRLSLAPDKVGAFASWETMRWIATHQEGSITANAGYEAYSHPQAEQLNRLQFETMTPWASVRHDFYTFELAMIYLRSYQPRIFFLSLGETDDWAHEGNYGRTLEALRQSDDRIRQLWDYLEATPQYQGKTTIVLTTDHGRGTAREWRHHGSKIKEAAYCWVAIVSPDLDARGEWSDTKPIYLNQIAATLCSFLGIDYGASHPAAGRPIAEVLTKLR